MIQCYFVVWMTRYLTSFEQILPDLIELSWSIDTPPKLLDEKTIRKLEPHLPRGAEVYEFVIGKQLPPNS